jgi:metallo-beta-lactamase family protein
MGMEFLDIKHHGAVEGVTGSCHELRLESGPGILIDCGLFQGAETSGKGADLNRLTIEFPIDHIQALIITHVHIDHVGRIPYLLATGFDKPIYCSAASATLLPLVLEDAVKIGFTRNQRLIDLFLSKIKSLIVPLPYKEWVTVCADEDVLRSGHENKESISSHGEIAIKLQAAGHILGSAYVECDCRLLDKEGIHSRQRVVFSGDLGAPYAPLLPAPRSPWRADTLIIESTYGDRLHEGRQHRRSQLKKIIERAMLNKGVLLIPAFSIGRTQEILYELEGLIHKHADKKLAGNSWRDIEIIVDSPLASKFTQVYESLKPHWDSEALRLVRSGRHPLSFEQLYTVNGHEEHLSTVNYIRRKSQPCIVVAASGMCAGGRIVNYLKALIGDPRTDVLFIGYQAMGTPGRTIQQYGPNGGYVELDSQRYDIRAAIYTISGYSAHADQKDLLNFVKRMRHKPTRVRIVHGDDRAKQGLMHKLKDLLPEAEVIIAKG